MSSGCQDVDERDVRSGGYRNRKENGSVHICCSSAFTVPYPTFEYVVFSA